MEKLLYAELARLGIDPEKAPAAAPQGARNAVFDLYASKVDVDGNGPAATKLIIMRWTEQLVGDYDENGEVNVSDLTPISARGWKRAVNYDASKYGAAWAPRGSPIDVGLAVLGQKPPVGCAAENWRLARIDGDANGEINITDISPIGQHWKQAISGYCVYRRGPGESSFTKLPDPEHTTSSLSLERATTYAPGMEQVNPDYAVRYIYYDVPEKAGQYTYYVAPYYEAQNGNTTSGEGPPSNQFSIHFETATDPGGDPVEPPPSEPNQAPTAQFMPEPSIGEIPLLVQFDATYSSDLDGLSLLYIWDFDGDGVDDSQPSHDAFASHMYTSAGFFHPRLTVVDDGALTDSVSSGIEATYHGQLPPTAFFTVDQQTGTAPLLVTFDPHVSSDDDAIIAAYWDFDGDGETDEQTGGISSTLNHLYESAGAYSPSLTLEDTAGLTDKHVLETPITVSANQPPIAELTATPSSGKYPLNVDANASASSDPEGMTISFEWDWDGDGVYDFSSGNDSEVFHSYEVAGSYNLTVRVTDSGGLMATKAVPINVSSNIPPEAAISASQISGIERETIQLNSSDSLDPDGSISQRDYDWEGDGIYDVIGGSSYTSHVYTTGSYNTTVKVTDNEGATDTASVTITIAANQPPAASLTASPDSGESPLQVALDASGTIDDDMQFIRYRWYLYYENDQEHWDFETTTPTLQTTYHEYGAHTAAIQVVDRYDASDWASVQITVNAEQLHGWYIYHLAAAENNVWAPQMGLAVVGGNPFAAWSDGSSGGDVYCARALDEQGLYWGERIKLTDNPESGDGFMNVSVAEINGKPAIACIAFYGQVRYCTANDVEGTDWQPWRNVNYVGGTGKSTSLIELGGRPAMAWINALGQLLYARALDSDGVSWPAATELDSQFNSSFAGHVDLRLVNTDHPAIAYVNVDHDINYLIGNDMDGTTWTGPITIMPGGGYNFWQGAGIGLGVAAGSPRVCYSGADQILFQTAPDGAGMVWEDPVVLADGQSSYLSVAEVAGIPAVATPESYIEASTVVGDSWSPWESIGISGTCVQLCEVAGALPAVVIHSSGSWGGGTAYYAVRLP